MMTWQGGTEKGKKYHLKNMNIIKIVVILLHIFSHNGFLLLCHIRGHPTMWQLLKKTSKLFFKFRLFFFFLDSEKMDPVNPRNIKSIWCGLIMAIFSG